MRSISFGRRIIEPSGHELVLIPGQEAPGPASELPNRDELKEQIRAALMSRIDPSVAGRIPRPTLRAEVGKLVSDIATEQRIQLNELEEAALARRADRRHYHGEAARGPRAAAGLRR